MVYALIYTLFLVSIRPTRGKGFTLRYYPGLRSSNWLRFLLALRHIRPPRDLFPSGEDVRRGYNHGHIFCRYEHEQNERWVPFSNFIHIHKFYASHSAAHRSRLLPPSRLSLVSSALPMVDTILHRTYIFDRIFVDELATIQDLGHGGDGGHLLCVLRCK